MKLELTTTETIFLENLRNYFKENKLIPDVRTMCKITGYSSTSSVWQYLHRLKDKGYIEFEDNKCRTYHLIEDENPNLNNFDFIIKNYGMHTYLDFINTEYRYIQSLGVQFFLWLTAYGLENIKSGNVEELELIMGYQTSLKFLRKYDIDFKNIK